ncbi:MAG: hypothetical protein RLO52_32950 [Sandaracinaceae bacterium]
MSCRRLRCLTPNVANVWTDARGRKCLVSDGELLAPWELDILCGRLPQWVQLFMR